MNEKDNVQESKTKKKFTQVNVKKDTKEHSDVILAQLSNKLKFKISHDHLVNYAIDCIQQDDGEAFKKWIVNKYISFYKQLL